ncbi:cytochrome P450 [archaeon]|nr:MAG: cytochrome P450 [archaeon]
MYRTNIAMVFDVFNVLAVSLLGYLLYWWLDVRKPIAGVTNSVGYPILGNLLDFLPHKLLKSLVQYRKTYGSVFLMRVFSQRVFVISDPTLAREVLMQRPKQFRRTRQAEYTGEVIGISKGLVHSNGALWGRIRRSTAPSFSQKSVGQKVEAIEQEVACWIERLQQKTSQGEVIDMTQEAFLLAIRVISRAAFGLEENNPVSSYFFSLVFLQDVKHLLAFMLQYIMNRLPPWLWRISPWYHYECTAREVAEKFRVHCQAVLDYKRSLPTTNNNSSMIDSLLDRSTKEVEEGGMTDEEIIHNLKVFYIAGSETTSITISWLCYFLSLHIHVQEKVRTEINKVLRANANTDKLDMESVKGLVYTLAVVKETMRLRNAVSVIGFELESKVHSVTLSNGLTVCQGDMVWTYLDGILWNDELFTLATEFLPDRWLPEQTDAVTLSKMEESFLAFGSGPRVCPGMSLAILESVLAIAHLIQRFHVRLACDPGSINRVVNLTSAPDTMPITLTPI